MKLKLKGCTSPLSAALLVLLLLLLHAVGEAGATTAPPTSKPLQDGSQCPELKDDHGKWIGSRAVGGTYQLACNEGYIVDVNSNRTFSEVCPPSGEWNIEAQCVDTDACRSLVNGCGPMGLCTNREGGGYRCVCVEGYELKRAFDGSGEWVCGEREKTVCDGQSCGAYGVCVDLSTTEGNFDSGNTREKPSSDTYRCSCASGYWDNGTSCAPLDCGELHDDSGDWVGSHTVGGEYTLKCRPGTYIGGGLFSEDAIQCPAMDSGSTKAGTWGPMVPRCLNAAKEARDAEFATAVFWLNAACALACVCTAAIAAGLTTGMLSLDPFQMEVLMHTRLSDVDEKSKTHVQNKQSYASRIRQVLADRHWLLVTLLLLNSLANEALPIFLDKLVPAYMAVLLSVTAVLIFGEVLPTAYFTGPDKIQIASRFVPLVRALRVLFCPIALPIARLLDAMLPEEDDLYSRAELSALIRLHGREREADKKPAHQQDHDEADKMSFCPCLAATREDPEGPEMVLEEQEIAVMTGIMQFKGLSLRSLSAHQPLQELQVVHWKDTVEEITEAISKGFIASSWVIVCRSPAARCAVKTQRHRRAPDVVFTDVLGVLNVGRLLPLSLPSASLSGQEKTAGAITPDLSPQDITYMDVDQTALIAFSMLAKDVRWRQASSQPIAFLYDSKGDKDRRDVILGVLTLDSLVTALTMGYPPKESSNFHARGVSVGSGGSDISPRSGERPLLRQHDVSGPI